MRQSRPLYRHEQLARMLNPRSIAIIGASARPGAFGERVLQNLCDYDGAIHLVNGRYTTIGDRPCHPSVTALADAPDVAAICVAREQVEGVVRECIAAGVGGMIVFRAQLYRHRHPSSAQPHHLHALRCHADPEAAFHRRDQPVWRAGVFHGAGHAAWHVHFPCADVWQFL